jgi:hypothetical protein
MAKQDTKTIPAYLTRVDSSRVLNARNVRWREDGLGILHHFFKGYSEKDWCYVTVGNQVYSVPREVSMEASLPLRLFLSEAPAIVDVSEAFDLTYPVKDKVEVTQALRVRILEKYERVRQIAIKTWVSALRKAPGEWNLERVLRETESFTISNVFMHEALVDPIVDQWRPQGNWADSTMLHELMKREAVRFPAWAGTTDDVRCFNYYQLSPRPSWCKVREGCYVGVRCAMLTINKGPVAVMVALDEAEGKAHCEKLMKHQQYGDIMLLVGSGQSVANEAQRMSDYLLGVDILKH